MIFRKYSIAYIYHTFSENDPSGKALATIIKEISRSHRVVVYAKKVDIFQEINFRFVKVPCFEKPLLLRYFSFHIMHVFSYLMDKLLNQEKFEIIHSIDSISFLANVISVYSNSKERLRIFSGRFKNIRTSFNLIEIYRYMFIVVGVIFESIIFRRKRVKLFISASQNLSSYLRGLYGISKPIFVIPHPVIWHHHYSNFRNFEGELTMIFPALGNWKSKGLDYLLDSLVIVKKSCKKFKLLVTGDGRHETNSYKKYVEKNNLQENVNFLGKIDNMQSLYLSCDILVLPSLSEAFPLVLLEAQSFGLPCIVTPFSGHEMIIQDSVNGFIVDWDVQSIAERIMLVYNNRKILNHMSINCLQKVKEFSPDTIAGKTLEAYNSVFIK